MSEILSTADVSRLMEHRAWVRALARRLLDDENAVDDVEQETWIAALRSGPDEPRALRAWLGSVASRFALQRLRGEGRRARRESAGVGAGFDGRAERSPDEVVAEADAHGRVVQEVLAMDEPYRATVLLRYFEGLSVPDVARRMDVPVETARTRLRRAHERLRERLDDRRRPLAVALAPLAGGGAAAGKAAAAAGATVAAHAPASLGLGAALAGSAAVVVVVVGAIGAGAWYLGGGGGAGGPNGAPAALVAQDAPGGNGGAGPQGGAPQGPGQPPGPPPTQGEKTAAAPPRDADAAKSWMVRDLRDGSPLAGMPLRVRRKRAEGDFWFDVTSDAEGRLPVKRKPGDTLHVNGASWFVAQPAEHDTGGATRPDPREIESGDRPEEATVWLYSKATVSGVVRSADPARPLDGADVQMFAAAGSLGSVTDGAHYPTDATWYRRRGLAEFPMDGAVKTDGRFSCELPLLGALQISATARRFRSASSGLGLRAGRAVQDLELALEPGVRVTGRLRLADGTPLRGAWAQVDVTRRFRRGEPVTAAEVLGRGGTLSSGAEGGFESQSAADETDVRGIFQFEVTAEGEATLFARLPGFRPARQVLGRLTKDVTGLDLVVEPAPAATVRIVRGDTAAAGETIQAQELDRVVSGWTWRTDAAGRARTDWLETGRTYVVALPGPTFGTFVWRGQTTIDLATLARDTSVHGVWMSGHELELAAPESAKQGTTTEEKPR